jgi:hypothetical protein
MGWASLKNGDLLRVAEDAGFDVFITADKNLQYQQNLTGRKLALVVLSTNDWPTVRTMASAIVDAINASLPGGFRYIESPSSIS